MTQPHYIDREAVLERLRALDFDGHYGEARFQDIADDIITLVAPMEAVAWREALEKIRDLKRRPTHHEIKSISQSEWERRSTRDMLREAREIADQALAVIPTEGGEGRE